MSKELLAAGILRDFRFSNYEDFELYLYRLDHMMILYKVIETFECSDGSVLVRIMQRYNDVALIEL